VIDLVVTSSYPILSQPTVSITRATTWGVFGSASASTQDPQECCTPDCTNPFKQVWAEASALGGSVIRWTVAADFGVKQGSSFQLQWSPSGGANSDDWEDCGNPVNDAAFLVDGSQRVYGVWNLCRYRVVLINDGETFVSPTAGIDGRIIGTDALVASEISRKELLRLQTTPVGTFGYLLQERRFGVLCSCVDPVTREQRNSACPICFGRNYVGGYHPPQPCWTADLTNEDKKKMVDHAGGKGNTADVARMARTVATLPVSVNDLWVNHYSDERYYVSRIRELASFRDVPLIYGLELHKAPRSDIVYNVPVPRVNPAYPACYTAQTIQVVGG